MSSFSIKDAAILAEASYSSERITSPKVIASCPHSDVQAHILEGKILLLPGSNSVRDYLRFNLRPLNLFNQQFRMDDDNTEKGHSGTRWHQGFLAYSRVVFDWLKGPGIKPSFIIGHSLGAAAAQILSKSYAAPAIAFAAPRPKKVNGPVKNDGKCLILNRVDDIVPSAVPGFSHMGPVTTLRPARRRAFPAHSMTRYIEIVEEAQQAGTLGQRWSG